jgi:hypothetical protein
MKSKIKLMNEDQVASHEWAALVKEMEMVL